MCYDLTSRLQLPLNLLTLGDIIVQDLLAWDTVNSHMSVLPPLSSLNLSQILDRSSRLLPLHQAGLQAELLGLPQPRGGRPHLACLSDLQHRL